MEAAAAARADARPKGADADAARASAHESPAASQRGGADVGEFAGDSPLRASSGGAAGSGPSPAAPAGGDAESKELGVGRRVYLLLRQRFGEADKLGVGSIDRREFAALMAAHVGALEAREAEEAAAQMWAQAGLGEGDRMSFREFVRSYARLSEELNLSRQSSLHSFSPALAAEAGGGDGDAEAEAEPGTPRRAATSFSDWATAFGGLGAAAEEADAADARGDVSLAELREALTRFAGREVTATEWERALAWARARGRDSVAFTELPEVAHVALAAAASPQPQQPQQQQQHSQSASADMRMPVHMREASVSSQGSVPALMRVQSAHQYQSVAGLASEELEQMLLRTQEEKLALAAAVDNLRRRDQLLQRHVVELDREVDTLQEALRARDLRLAELARAEAEQRAAADARAAEAAALRSQLAAAEAQQEEMRHRADAAAADAAEARARATALASEATALGEEVAALRARVEAASRAPAGGGGGGLDAPKSPRSQRQSLQAAADERVLAEERRRHEQDKQLLRLRVAELERTEEERARLVEALQARVAALEAAAATAARESEGARSGAGGAWPPSSTSLSQQLPRGESASTLDSRGSKEALQLQPRRRGVGGGSEDRAAILEDDDGASAAESHKRFSSDVDADLALETRRSGAQQAPHVLPPLKEGWTAMCCRCVVS